MASANVMTVRERRLFTLCSPLCPCLGVDVEVEEVEEVVGCHDKLVLIVSLTFHIAGGKTDTA